MMRIEMKGGNRGVLKVSLEMNININAGFWAAQTQIISIRK